MLNIEYIIAIFFTLIGSEILASNANRDVIVLLSSECGGVNPLANAVSQVAAKQKSKNDPGYQFESLEYAICNSQVDAKSKIPSLNEIIMDFLFSLEWWENRVRGILVYLPRELFEHAVNLIKFTDIQVYQLASYEDDQTVPDWQQFLTPLLSVEANIIVLLQNFRWKDVLIIEFRKDPSLKIEEIINHSKMTTVRYLAPFPRTSWGSIFEKLNEELKPIIVIAIGEHAGEFMVTAAIYGVEKHFWVLFSDFNVGHNYLMNDFIPEHVCYHNITIPYNRSQISLALPRFRNEVASNKELVEIVEKVFFAIFDKGNYITQKVRNMINVASSFSQIDKTGSISELENLEGIKFFMEYRRIQNCLSWTVQKVDNPNAYSKQLDFSCQKYKRYISDHYCPSPTRVFQIGEYDPNEQCYYPVIENEVDKTHYIAKGFVIVGVVLCSIILFAFIKNRKTPVARSSHLDLSLAQITFCLSYFASSLYLLHEAPTTLSCTLQLYITSASFTAIHSIAICKVDKIITICSLKVMIDDNIKRNLLMKQTFPVFISVGLGFLIPTKSSPVVARVLDVDTHGNEYLSAYCDTHMSYSIAHTAYWCLLLALLLFQAIRGQGRLPRAYNEGKAILISTSISLASVLLLHILFESRTEYTTITISFSLINLLLCLYTGRVYIMLVNRKRDTKTYLKRYTQKRGFIFGDDRSKP